MPSKRDIKIANTESLLKVFMHLCTEVGAKPSTVAGVGASMFVSALLEQAQLEGIDVARRNLDRTLEMLTAIRAAPHADAMHQAAVQMREKHMADVFKRDSE